MSARHRLDRRSFIRGSGMVAAALVVPPFPLMSFYLAAQQKERRVTTASLSRQFGRWVAALRFEDLPLPVIDRAKGVTLQGLRPCCSGPIAGSGSGCGQAHHRGRKPVRPAPPSW